MPVMEFSAVVTLSRSVRVVIFNRGYSVRISWEAIEGVERPTTYILRNWSNYMRIVVIVNSRTTRVNYF